MVMHFQVLQKHDISCNYQFSKEYHILWNEWGTKGKVEGC
jgi:hypothetical protein